MGAVSEPRTILFPVARGMYFAGNEKLPEAAERLSIGVAFNMLMMVWEVQAERWFLRCVFEVVVRDNKKKWMHDSLYTLCSCRRLWLEEVRSRCRLSYGGGKGIQGRGLYADHIWPNLSFHVLPRPTKAGRDQQITRKETF